MGQISLPRAALASVPSSLGFFSQHRHGWLPAALLALGACVAHGQAQDTHAAQSLEPAGHTATQPASSTGTGDDNAWLASTGRLYYSTAKAGLKGFDCTVHPDWHELFISSNPGAPVSENDEHLALLNSVKINLHAHLNGGSTMDWNRDAAPDKPLDDASNEILSKMHQATEQTIEGFLQFWTPFVDGSVVPDSADGLTITHTGTQHTIHAEQAGVALTEIFSSDLLLQHFDVDMKAVSIKFQPAYQPTDQGLLVKSFQAHVQPAGTPADQAQDMQVNIEYQTLDGFPIPARLNMAVTNTGNFNFVFDGCTVSRTDKPAPATSVKPALQ
jgi:hypothetical protein